MEILLPGAPPVLAYNVFSYSLVPIPGNLGLVLLMNIDGIGVVPLATTIA